MPNYRFLDLSPLDFEELCRDLLQKELCVRLESFAPGKDGGIDFRYTIDDSNGIVIQCKRIEDWADLWASLKRELPKVRRLNPLRYILAVSHDLTDTKKNKILRLFRPHILNKGDIKGRSDLNNLLTDYPEVEQNHPKLWLPSTNVLERIMHSRIVNQGLFEKREIERAVQVYVQNESYGKAARILNERRWVIISGIPGIGKTTLARMLVASYMAEGFEELVSASDSIKDAYELAKENRKQIFFFDDFLGRVFLDRELPTNEDKRIKTFIDIAESNNNKLFILTTREYILSQAMQRYEFRTQSINLSKCIVDLAHYTRKNRARILYNHLYYSDLPDYHLEDLLRDNNYLKIIDHPNYSPRIIDEMVGIKDIWRSIPRDQFVARFLENLGDQEMIWRRAFENEISAFSQCLLCNLMTAGSPILYEDLQDLMSAFGRKFASKYGIAFSELDLKKSVRELEGSFITISKKRFGGGLIVSFHNPSVEDFLLSYLKNNRDVVSDIIEAAPFFNQFFKVFALAGSAPGEMYMHKLRGRLVVDGPIKELIVNRSMVEINELGISELQSIEIPRKEAEGRFSRLSTLLNETRGLNDPRLRQFAELEFERLYSGWRSNQHVDFDDFVLVCRRLGSDYFDDKREMILHSFSKVRSYHQFEKFERLRELIPDEFDRLTETDTFKETVRQIIERETDYAEENDQEELESILEAARSVDRNYDVFVDDLVETIEEKIDEIEVVPEADPVFIDPPTEEDANEGDEGPTLSREYSEESDIASMLGSLRSRT